MGKGEQKSGDPVKKGGGVGSGLRLLRRGGVVVLRGKNGISTYGRRLPSCRKRSKGGEVSGYDEIVRRKCDFKSSRQTEGEKRETVGMTGEEKISLNREC